MAKLRLILIRLTEILFSKLRARLQKAKAGQKYNQEHGWIENDMYNKTSLVNISSICIERLVAAGLHSNKI